MEEILPKALNGFEKMLGLNSGKFKSFFSIVIDY